VHPSLNRGAGRLPRQGHHFGGGCRSASQMSNSPAIRRQNRSGHFSGIKAGFAGGDGSRLVPSLGGLRIPFRSRQNESGPGEGWPMSRKDHYFERHPSGW